jgi:hypothetical protein
VSCGLMDENLPRVNLPCSRRRSASAATHPEHGI